MITLRGFLRQLIMVTHFTLDIYVCVCVCVICFIAATHSSGWFHLEVNLLQLCVSSVVSLVLEMPFILRQRDSAV